MDLYSVFTHPTSGVSIAVGTGGGIYRSTSTGTWQQMVSGTVDDLYAITWGSAWGVEAWVAVGADGTILTSPTGYTWTQQTSNTSKHLYGIAWAGVFLVVGQDGTMLLSEDVGTTWIPISSGSTKDLFKITVDYGLYTIVGEDTIVVGELAVAEADNLVAEPLGILEEPIGTAVMESTVTETVNATVEYNWESNGVSGGNVGKPFVFESFFAGDYGVDLYGSFNHVLTEVAGSLELWTGSARSELFASSSMTLSSSSAYASQLFRTVIEQITADGTITIASGKKVVEVARILSSIDAAGSTFNGTVIQSLNLIDRLRVSWLLVAEESLQLSATELPVAKKVSRIAERLTALGISSGGLSAGATAAVIVSLSDVFSSGKGGSVSESLTASEAILAQAAFMLVQVEEITMSAMANYSGMIRAVLSETVTLSSSFTLNQILNNLIEEGISFTISFGLGDQTYSGWVMNTRNNAVTEYDNYPFNSFTKIGQTYYGANSSGLYALDGDTDDGDEILASATLGIMDFSGETKTLLGDCFLALRSDGEVLIKIKSDDNIERWYKISSTDDVLGDKRAKPAKGVKSRYWTFTLENIDGSDFEITEFTLIPVSLKRRLQ